MATASTLQAALQDPPNTTELTLSPSECAAMTAADAAKLTRVTKLKVTGPEDGSLLLAPALFALPVESLTLRHVRASQARGWSGLRHLTLMSHFLQDDLDLLCRQPITLESLEVCGLHPKQPLVLPPQVAELRSLKRLLIVSCNMNALPDELEQLPLLREIVLRGQSFNAFPKVLTRLHALESLEFSGCLNSAPQDEAATRVLFPDSLAAMSGLRHLNLRGSFGGTRWDHTAFEMEQNRRGFDVPPALAELSDLHSLDLSLCHIGSLDNLKKLTSLRSLTLSANSIDDLRPIESLTQLRTLNVAINTVANIAPIAKLPGLETLDVTDCPIKNTRPILEHPSLQSLHADDRLLAVWERRHEVRALPNVAQLCELLKEQAEHGLQTFARWVTLHSMRDTNGAYAFLGIDSHGGDAPLVIEPVTRALSHAISSNTLVAVVRALFMSARDNFAPVLDAVALLVERRDLSAQNAVIEAFREACRDYDAGRRAHANTVHDRLIDELFPRFEGEPLKQLLVWCSDDHLEADGMDVLFAPALARLSDARSLEQVEARRAAYEKLRSVD